ncbi:6 7-dimethyl-8-ribityllumazine synthase chloroplastic [Bienertia sinuspersici]
MASVAACHSSFLTINPKNLPVKPTSLQQSSTFLRFSAPVSSSSSLPGFGLVHVASDKKSYASFAVTNAARELEGYVTKAQGFRFAVVVARFNEFVTRRLMEGALDTFKKYSVVSEDIDVIWVPGAYELGVTALTLGKSGKYHAIVCIGAVAISRAGGKAGNKGSEAALTAIEMASLFEHHLKA